MMTSDGNPWFEPKSFGYGAGLPIAWQGWVLLGAYLLVVVGSAFLARRSPVGYLAILVLATAAFLMVCQAKTRGGWHWRGGGVAASDEQATELTGSDVVRGSEPKER